MEWKLPENKMQEYNSMLKSAQELEMTLGSTQFRVYKLSQMRQDLEKHIKEWWDKTATEMKLDPNNDYAIDRNGTIRSVDKKQPRQAPQQNTQAAHEKPTPPAAGQQNPNVGTNASQLK